MRRYALAPARNNPRLLLVPVPLTPKNHVKQPKERSAGSKKEEKEVQNSAQLKLERPGDDEGDGGGARPKAKAPEAAEGEASKARERPASLKVVPWTPEQEAWSVSPTLVDFHFADRAGLIIFYHFFYDVRTGLFFFSIIPLKNIFSLPAFLKRICTTVHLS